MYEGKRIYLWGDSIGKGVVFSPERKRYCLSGERCEKTLREQGIWLENHARMGATAPEGLKAFEEEGAEPGGYAVIQYGGNDCDLDWQAVSDRPGEFHDGRTPLEAFLRTLRVFAGRAREKGLMPVMVLPPPLYPERYFKWVCRGRNERAVLAYLGDVGHIGRWHALYVETIREAARETGSALLDAYTPFLRAWNFPELMCEDGIHPSAGGQRLIAQTALAALGRT